MCIKLYFLILINWYGPGIDIGAQSDIIATVKKGGIEIVLNESSNRLRWRRRFDLYFANGVVLSEFTFGNTVLELAGKTKICGDGKQLNTISIYWDNGNTSSRDERPERRTFSTRTISVIFKLS